MHHAPVRGLTIKAALSLGFGLTLSLWLFTGYQFARGIAEVQRRSAGIGSRYVQAQDLLSSFRTHVLTTSGFVRDALLDPNPADATRAHQRAYGGLSSVRGALTAYVPVLDSPAEQERLQQLHAELDRFAATIRNVLDRGASDSGKNGRQLLNAVFVPARAAILRASDELQATNRAAFIQYQSDLTVIHNAAERDRWQRLGLALALSISIAIFATLYAGRLEKRLIAQLAKDAMNTRALQNLSTKLINAQEEERGRIARELHDEVGQALTAIKVELTVAQRKINTIGASDQQLESAQLITDRTLQTVRDLSRLLRPAALDDFGLAAAVDSYLRDFSRRSNIKADLQQDDMGERLAPEVEVASYRIIQEALTNIAKHAHASTCRVSLRRDAANVTIIIEDDGRGFDSSDLTESARKGLGLLGIRERVSQLGGSMNVASTVGQGTTLRVDLPAGRHDEPHLINADEGAYSALRAESANG